MQRQWHCLKLTCSSTTSHHLTSLHWPRRSRGELRWLQYPSLFLRTHLCSNIASQTHNHNTSRTASTIKIRDIALIPRIPHRLRDHQVSAGSNYRRDNNGALISPTVKNHVDHHQRHLQQQHQAWPRLHGLQAQHAARRPPEQPAAAGESSSQGSAGPR